jgi:hypothetical protein
MPRYRSYNRVAPNIVLQIIETGGTLASGHHGLASSSHGGTRHVAAQRVVWKTYRLQVNRFEAIGVLSKMSFSFKASTKLYEYEACVFVISGPHGFTTMIQDPGLEPAGLQAWVPE